MTPQPDRTSFSAASADRRPQAVWPWLLLPLVALALFYVLSTVKKSPAHPANHAEVPAETASSEVTEPR